MHVLMSAYRTSAISHGPSINSSTSTNMKILILNGHMGYEFQSTKMKLSPILTHAAIPFKQKLY